MSSSLVQHVTEIVYIPLRAGIDIDDDATPEGEALAAAFRIISAQEGYLGSYYSRQLELPSILMWFISEATPFVVLGTVVPGRNADMNLDWSSHDAHIRFTHAPVYETFLGEMGKLFAAPPSFHHFLSRPFPPDVLTFAPCTEVATFYGTSPTFHSNVQRFVNALSDAVPDGFQGTAFGPVLEHIAKPGGSETEPAVVLCIGWASKEHHLRFRDESPVFKENIWLLREGNKGADVVHLALKNVAARITNGSWGIDRGHT
ncbi:hypothetical protein PVAG01_09201 [Phlyctema vagabunda]|uniref:Uncharacterized protein n=1 Tax=Phlyctema vagabunda TaxID=108571 RepID=A0ABR4P6Q4_9HELO